MLTLPVEAVSLLVAVESCKAHPHQQFSRHQHKQPAA